MKLRIGDKVLVITGKDKGKRGQVERVISPSNKVIVNGINILKRHRKSTAGQGAGIIESPHPIDMSNVVLINPDTDLASRFGLRRDGKSLTRVFKPRQSKNSNKVAA